MNIKKIILSLSLVILTDNSYAYSNPDCKLKTYLTGDKEDIVTKTQFGLILMGGSDDVDLAFKEMIKRSGGGDFIVLRSSGEDGYNNYVYSDLGGVNSIETIVIDSIEKAMCPQVEEKLKKAEAVFIAGGDQSDYYKYWKNTPVQKTLNYLINTKKVPIGGTSAGLAILGETVFTAELDTVTSEEALKNALDKKITLKNDFLNIPVLKNIITDTHFDQRKRQGRLISFLANSLKNNKVIKGIGVDEKTALLLEENGDSKVLGSHYVWFFSTSGKPDSYKPLNWSKSNSIKAIKIKNSEKNTIDFNILSWKAISSEYKNISYNIKNGILK
jgi:cyanophycinase